jgi:hypothetical protein
LGKKQRNSESNSDYHLPTMSAPTTHQTRHGANGAYPMVESQLKARRRAHSWPA